jgi:hypothetical protein
MEISSNIQKSLFDLAKLILVNKNDGPISPEWPFRFGKIPDDVKRDGVDADSLITCGEDYAQYVKCLVLLSDAESLKYIS